MSEVIKNEMMSVDTTAQDFENEVEELNDSNKKAIAKIEEVIADNNMQWTWESIDYVLNKENVSFNTLTLRDGSFKNVRVLIQAGLPKAKRTKEEAFKIMQELTDAGISMDTVHIVLKDTLERKHFFTDTDSLENLRNLMMSDYQPQMSLNALKINTALMTMDMSVLTQK